ncbi:MAG TPA: hypothetical protein VF476_13510 [Chitinophagaceae bacterium]
MNLSFKKSLALIAGIIFFFSCQKGMEKPILAEKEFTKTSANRSSGATQISGLGFWDAADGCNSGAQGADFALTMTGDLEGCLYVFVDEFECSPSGTYSEIGREKFVGTYNGEAGEFWTTYRFEAKYEGCAENGSYLGLEIFGRCQHPIVEGSGKGVFDGVKGRLDLKDDIEAGNYPYRGHFRF